MDNMDRIITEIKYGIRDFVMVYGFAVMATLVFRWLYHIDATISLDYLRNLLFISLAGILPRLVYYTAHELTEKELLVRDILHTLILVVVLMTIGRYMGLWDDFVSGAYFFVALICIDFAIRFLGYSKDVAIAAKINKKLKERRAQSEE